MQCLVDRLVACSFLKGNRNSVSGKEGKWGKGVWEERKEGRL